jgi:hypothetical protein
MTARVSLLALLLATLPAIALAHDGPPFPIVSDRIAGPYRVSIWTDPDTTDDGSPGGQFWVRIHQASDGEAAPAGTRSTVAISPLDRPGNGRTAGAEPVRGDITNQFAALFMDHEGRFAVQATIDGPLGPAVVDAEVDATYDLRPPPYLFFLYLAPFLLVGLLWGGLLIRRSIPAGSRRLHGRPGSPGR